MVILSTLVLQQAMAQQSKHTVASAVPFLRVSTDVRSSGMGDAGIGTSADVYAAYKNLAKTPFNTAKTGFAASYTPWLGEVSDNIYLAALTGYHKLDDKQAVSASFRYFGLGNAVLTDEAGNILGSSKPNEFAFDAGYARKLSEEFSLAIGARYIYSRLVNGMYNGTDYSAASGFSGDISLFYTKTLKTNDVWSAGLVISNLGTKINYTNNSEATNFLPANIGIGTSYKIALENGNSITLQAEGNKLMVPTAPVNETELAAYRKTAVVNSWFDSFSKNKGGFSTSQGSVGVEVGVQDILDIRAGFALDARYRNNEGDSRGFWTFGVGLKYKKMQFDASYLAAPMIGMAGNPAANTFRFGVGMHL